MRRGGVGALVAATALAAPAGAHAGDVTTVGQCFSSAQSLTVSGSAFTPNAAVAIVGDVTASAQADPTGAFSALVTVPRVTELGPRTVTMVMIDQANPQANTATCACSWCARPTARTCRSPGARAS